MGKLETTFLESISAGLDAYNAPGGSRSNKKLIPIHGFLSDVLSAQLGKKYSIRSLGIGDGREYCAQGKYYEKDLDIAVLYEGVVLGTISFKFVTSNFLQNANNYFENLMGETANIRRENIGFAHLLVLRRHTPYYSKNKGNLRGDKIKTEIINEKHLQKYIRLFKDMDFPHKPDLIGICVIDVENDNRAYFADLNEKDFGFTSETKKLLKTEFSLPTFLKKFIHLIKLKT